MSVGMRDFKYRALAQAPIPDWGWDLKDFKSECLREVSETFLWNLLRTSTFALMPAWIALEATRDQFWRENVASPDDSDEVWDAKMNAAAENWRNMPNEEFRKFIDKVGIEFIEAHLGSSRATALGIDAIFTSIVVESWTAFETLAAELWVTTLDNNSSIATRVESAGVLRIGKKKNVRTTYDLTTNPGSYWFEIQRAVFQRLEEIRTLYVAAFGDEVKNLFDETEDGYIAVLSAVRNVIVHKRGRADLKFLTDIGGFSKFDGVKEHELLLLDGKDVQKMRDAAMQIGRKLIQLADAALSPKEP